MTNYQEKFLEAEETLNSLIEAMKDYKIEAENYKSASETLVDAGEKLQKHLGVQEKILEEMRTAVTAFRSLGAAELFEKLETINIESQEKQGELVERLEVIRGEFFHAIGEVNKKQENSFNKLQQIDQLYSKFKGRLQWMTCLNIVLTFIVAVGVVITLILSLQSG